MTLDAKIESVLFYKGEPVKIDKLAKIFKKEQAEVKEALATLEKRLSHGGLRLVFNDDEVMLGTTPEASPVITELSKEELSGELGKAGLETLSIILYKNPASKKEIDYIRGVNSSFILRNLSIRGLVERFEKKGSRSAFYKPTTELLSFMGLSRIEDLPEFQTVKNEMLKLENQNPDTESQ